MDKNELFTVNSNMKKVLWTKKGNTLTRTEEPIPNIMQPCIKIVTKDEHGSR